MTTPIGSPLGVIASHRSVVAVAPPNPDQIPDLWGWWDASDAASIVLGTAPAVAQWNDKTANGRNMYNATATQRPATGIRTMNGKNVLDFDGYSGGIRYLRSGVQSLPQPYTIVAVAQYDNLDTGRQLVRNVGIISTTASSWTMSAGGAIVNGAQDALPHLFVGTFNGTSSTFHVDGIGVTGGSGAATGTELFISGTSSLTSWDGAIAEVAIYSRALTDPERTGLQTSLKAKWATT